MSDTMTFDQMYDQAVLLGYSVDEMRRNCEAQRDSYRRLSRQPDDMWATASKRCDELFVWLSNK